MPFREACQSGLDCARPPVALLQKNLPRLRSASTYAPAERSRGPDTREKTAARAKPRAGSTALTDRLSASLIVFQSKHGKLIEMVVKPFERRLVFHRKIACV